MTPSKLEQVAWLHIIAAQFRGFAAQTEWPAYRTRMLETAADLDREAAKLDHDRPDLRRRASSDVWESDPRYGRGKSH